jgi:thiamine biosynthesis lipoprotein
MKEFLYNERHMGTEVSLSFVCSSKDKSDKLAQSSFATIHEYELRFSRFLPTSELTLLNENGSKVVSKEFIQVLTRSLELAALTKHAFNPLVQVASLGYRINYPDTPNTVLVDNEIYDTDLSKIIIDNETNKVTLGPKQKLDFGGILKGYLAAQIADQVMTTPHDLQGCIINIGGDLTTRGVDELHEPFIFFLYNPVTDGEIPVAIKDTSLATSGTYARRWHTNQGTKHHIVNSTNRENPTVDNVAVSIISEDGAKSEALTKLFLTKGETLSVTTVSPEQHAYQYFLVANNGDIKSNII